MKNRVAIYCRCSTAYQNLDIQINDLTKYAELREFNIVKIFQEEAISGTKRSRPELDQMMTLARKRKIDFVLIWKLDRLGRNTSHLLNLIDEFESLNVALISYKETIDLSTPLGRAMVTILSALSAFERETLRERVIAGIENAKRKGKELGRPRLKCGEEVIRLRNEGLTYNQISTILKISHGSITNLLRKKVHGCK